MKQLLRKAAWVIAASLQAVNNRVKRVFINEWEVVIWYDPIKKTTYRFKKIEKVTAKHIKGKLVSGEPFELQAQEPFNFQIRKVK